MVVAPGAPLWRYAHLIELRHVLSGQQLRLTRVDRFHDPFEGSVPNQQIEDQGVILRGGALMMMAMESAAAHFPGMARPYRVPTDPWALMSIRRKVAARSAHASCWTKAPETEPRWRLYCNDEAPGQGIAMRTTYEKLEASVAHHGIIVQGISYRHYHVGPAFTDDRAPFLHKRMGFHDEEEIRLLSCNEAHKNALAYALTADGRFGLPPAPPAELPEHIHVAWNPLDVLDGVVVSPYATADYERRVREVFAALAPAALSLIELSRFSARSANPLF
ncbi:MAG: hypothetical protein JSS86_00175 [Cyanobacteria bacterium SZAS LIN-2]|nr:hypothetical protein [Cyanobacteria bacterium SZAS LIN-2]